MRNTAVQLVVVTSLLAVIAGCDSTSETARTDWTEFNEETVALALGIVAAAGDLYVGEYYTAGVDEACAAAVEYLEGQEGVLSAGVAPDSSVWVHFSNDFSATILEETFGGTSGAGRTPPMPVESQAGGEAVGSSLVLAPCLWDLPDTHPGTIAAHLDTCMGWNLAPVVMTDSEVSVANLQQTLETGIGTLCWSGHGTLVPPDTGACVHVCALLTGESYTDAEALAHELAVKYAGLVGPGSDYLRTVWVKDRFVLAVMPGFVRAHGQFDRFEQLPVNQTKSLAYVSCCHSSGEMGQAFMDAGVDVYWGWSWVVESSFAQAVDAEMFRLLCDTCTAGEATAEVDAGMGLVCPTECLGGNAELGMFGDPLVMIKAQMRVGVDGGTQRCYGVAATEGTVNLVSGGYGPDLRFVVGASFPGGGTWDCTTDDAIIFWRDTDQEEVYYSVARGYYGVSGTVSVSAYDADRTYGTFSGTLGYWEEGSNPFQDSPTSTKTITDGMFKHTGKRL